MQVKVRMFNCKETKAAYTNCTFTKTASQPNLNSDLKVILHPKTNVSLYMLYNEANLSDSWCREGYKRIAMILYNNRI